MMGLLPRGYSSTRFEGGTPPLVMLPSEEDAWQLHGGGERSVRGGRENCATPELNSSMVHSASFER